MCIHGFVSAYTGAVVRFVSVIPSPLALNSAHGYRFPLREREGILSAALAPPQAHRPPRRPSLRRGSRSPPRSLDSPTRPHTFHDGPPAVARGEEPRGRPAGP